METKRLIIKNKLLNYYSQEYNEKSYVIKAINQATDYYIERKYKELIVCKLYDKNLILPFVIEHVKSNDRYKRIDIPQDIYDLLKD